MTYKNRNNYILFGAICFGVFVYFFTISKTFRLKQAVEQQEMEIERVKDAPTEIAKIEHNLKSIDAKMKRYLFSEERNQEYVMGLVSKFCASHQLILREFPQGMILEKGDFNLETTVISAQGSFLNLTKLIYYFEQQIKIGRVSSVSFTAGMDYKTKKKMLVATIFLQNIRKKT